MVLARIVQGFSSAAIQTGAQYDYCGRGLGILHAPVYPWSLDSGDGSAGATCAQVSCVSKDSQTHTLTGALGIVLDVCANMEDAQTEAPPLSHVP